MEFFFEYLFEHLFERVFSPAFSFEFQNEFQTMQIFLNKDFSDARRDLAIQSVHSKKANSSIKSSAKSESLRKQGYKLFKVSPTKNALAAAHKYTNAIFAAPLGSEALALAHADRAMALQQFGYFSEAYDDCTCALELGYPISMQHKIIIRQGHCALNLGDVTLLRKHVDTLNDLKLDDDFVAEVQKLQKGLEELQPNLQPNSTGHEQQIALYRDKVKILKSPTKGRFMIATKPIEENEFIFSDRATSFVPFDEVRICQQCAATQLIPFPCYQCYGKVVYCSAKCRTAHKTTHEYECMAYQIGLLPTTDSLEHLAFRIVLDGIQQVIPFLRSKRTAKEIWFELTDEDSELLQNAGLEYVQVLRRVTNLDNKPTYVIGKAAKASVQYVAYLSTFTNFFSIHFKDTAASRHDWELIIGSLILRHIGQNRAHSYQVGFMTRILNENDYDFESMADNLWVRPLHVRRGYLHQKMRGIKAAFLSNYPYFGLMNHSCESSLKVKLTGRYLSVFTTKKIKTKEEITLNYTGRVSDMTKECRRARLESDFDIECNCSICIRDNRDDDVKFHRYRCDNSKCRSIFTPPAKFLYWWNQSDVNAIRCTKCNNLQRCLVSCVAEIHSHLKSMEKCTSRNKVFKCYKDLDRWLLDNHKLKCIILNDVVVYSLKTHIGRAPLSNKDFIILNNICQVLLSYANEMKKTHDIHFMCIVSCVWDLIALGKYKWKPEEMQDMLEATKTLPEEMKIVMINYYNDFISTTIDK